MSAFCARTCRHGAFVLNDGHRAFRSFAEALAYANRQATETGRLTVRRHVSPWFKRGVWFVQQAPGRQVDPPC